MATILDRIVAYKREEIVSAKAALPLPSLEEKARAGAPVRGFMAAIEAKSGDGRPALIAEIKKASPSKGLIRADFDSPELARSYAAGGAACLSVLTDEPSFQGHRDYLVSAREASALPVLRKDFMLDPYQVVEARAWGADCILVILACTSDSQANELCAAARAWGMDVLAEVHDADELDRALALDTRLIGINNRNLDTFETTLETTGRLAPGIPADRIVVSESGIFTPADIATLAGYGARACLVGESLMRQDDVEAATRSLLAVPLQAKETAAQ